MINEINITVYLQMYLIANDYEGAFELSPYIM